ncbi:hypothetical protein CHUAL_003948 [Chamberlinius hualienensis]
MESNVVLTAFYPIAVLAKFCGYFPLCNLGRRLSLLSHLTTFGISLNIILTVINISLMSVSNSNYFKYYSKIFYDNLRNSIYNCFFSAYRLNGYLIILHFALVKQKSIIRLFKHVGGIQHLNSFGLKRQKLTKFGYFLASTVVTFSVVYAVCIDNCSPYQLPVPFRLIAGLGSFTILFSYNFLATFVVYFNFILRWHFDGLANELNELCLAYKKVSDFDRRLSVIRRRHEHILALVDELYDVLSPIFTVYLVMQSVSVCINVNELVEHIVQHHSNVIIVRTIIFILIRFLPVMAVCVISDSLTQMATLNGDYNNCSFLELSRESEFQINLLLVQLKRRKVKISANGFVTVDKKLLAELKTQSLSNRKLFAMEDDFILTAFYPVALVAKIFGCFPFCNLGRRVVLSSQLKFHWLSFELLLTLLMLTLMVLNISSYFRYMYIIVFENLRYAVYNGFFAFYRFNGIVIFLQLVLFKQKSVITFFQHFNRIQHLNYLKLRRRALIILGYMLAVAIVGCDVFYAYLVYDFYIDMPQPEQLFSLLGACAHLTIYNFVAAFVVYFNFVFRWHFNALETELNEVCQSYQSILYLDKRLSLIRRSHEQLIILIEEFNDVISPIMTLYMVIQFVAVCANANELAEHIKMSESIFEIFKKFVFIIIRFVPLITVCITSSRVKQSAHIIDNEFNGCSFIKLSTESEFQINLLLIQTKRREAKILADDLVAIDNRLLAQQIVSVVTYIVVMIEVGNLSEV